MARTIDELIAEMPADSRARIKSKSRQMVNEMLAEAESLSMVRKAHDKTQDELAQTLGIKTNAITQLEKRADMLLSTLRKYIGACGGELVLAVRTKGGHTVMLESFRALSSDSVESAQASANAAAKAVRASRALTAKATGKVPPTVKSGKRSAQHA